MAVDGLVQSHNGGLLMTEAEWGACQNAPAMLEVVRGRTGDRKLRLLACACARYRWSGLVEDEYRRAVTAAEQCADGFAGRGELRAAQGDIWDISWGEVRGAPDANSVAKATVDDFAGIAAERSVANLSGEAADLVREILGNPFRAAGTPDGAVSPGAAELARSVYERHSFDELPRLAELLTKGGCRDQTLLDHLRSPGPHFRGCWALDAVLGKGQGKNPVTEAEWVNATHPFEMLRWWEYYRGKPSARKQRLLACACCRLISHLMTDGCLRQGVETAEAYADGLVSGEELARLHEQARTLGLSRGEVLQHMSGNTPEKAAVTDAWRVAHAVADAAGRDDGLFGNAMHYAAKDGGRGRDTEDPGQAALIRDILGSPLRQPFVAVEWRTATVLELARGIYEDRAFDRMPELAIALQDVGCDDVELLGHCRGPNLHVLGCWVLDLVRWKS
jgi:hypothetical protein